MNDFRTIAHWCQEYLELQHARDVGRTFGDLLRVLGDIASSPRDGIDRFDWLKQREEEVTRLLGELSIAHEKAQTERAINLQHANANAAKRTKLFVYGTLKRGFSRASALADQRFIGPAQTQSQYRMYDCGGYPGLVESEAGAVIEGELWEVDGIGLARLDEIEGVNLKLYRRGAIHLAAPFETESVESYFYARSTRHLRDCGPAWR